MKKIVLILLTNLCVFAGWAKQPETTGKQDREYWVELLYKISAPVLKEMSEGNLHKSMQIELSPSYGKRNSDLTYLEAFARTIGGVAPWLSLPDDDTKEGKMRKQVREWALKAYAHSVDPESPDYLAWRNDSQAMVDGAFIAESFLRAYDQLWEPLDSVTKQRYIKEFQQLRRINPPYNNWLLFSATIEVFLHKAGAQSDAYRISSALRKIDEWYVGDGWYADGPHFAFDYYNSYVIQPMYMECLGVMSNNGNKGQYEVALKRIQKYSIILERLISPEGTIPVFGRSIPYRSGALQALSWVAWQRKLPKELTSGQVRAGVTAVLRRMFEDDSNFTEKGYLTLGFVGHQPDAANSYTNNGSLYLTTFSFLPLGLPADDEFWTSEPQDWTSKKAWSGQKFPQDHSWL